MGLPVWHHWSVLNLTSLFKQYEQKNQAWLGIIRHIYLCEEQNGCDFIDKGSEAPAETSC